MKLSLLLNLSVLAEVEARGLKRVLFIGVGCVVSVLCVVELYLGLDVLYVVGMNCIDNGRWEGFNKFIDVASDDSDTVMYYEFM